MKKLYKGIEPIIAVVILVAITLVIAIGVIGWIMGWWGGMGATESLKLYPDSKLYSNGSVLLHVANEGSAAAVIYKIEVAGKEATTITTQSSFQGVTCTNNQCTLNPGADATISASANIQLTPGAKYVVKVYTKAGNVYSITLTAESSSS